MKKTHLLILTLLLSITSIYGQTDIVITEIGYNQAEDGIDSTEFIELFNKGVTTENLEDYSFTAGISFTLPSITMEPGDYVVLTIDSLAMISTYGYVGAYQWTSGTLNDDGEGITLRDAGGGLVDAVTYNDVLPWPVSADGEGKTIVLCDPEANNAFGVNWAASETSAGITVNGFEVFGSPGAIDGECVECEETSSSITEEVCGSYTVPSGDETYTESGIYEDIIPNAAGCDSVITIDLTVNLPSESEIVEISCGPYTVPSGDETYEMSGVYMDTIPNAVGCDSIITIDLSIGAPTESEIVEISCGPYTVPSGDETYEMSGVYMDTIPNLSGCDSIMIIDLTVNMPSESEIAEISCGPYTVPSGDETYEMSGVYLDTIPNVAGCDSIITIDLSIGEPSESEIVAEACGSYTVPSGDETYEMSGVYMDTIPNLSGCDSIITIDVTILMNSSSAIAETVCESYTVPSGDETYTESGVYEDIIPNAVGCDSIITIDLTVVGIDNGVTTTATDITANQDGATYQWVDCDNDNEPIDGETDQTFTPTSNGNYAVEITLDGCTDISDCVNFNSVGLGEDQIFDQVRIYPNPSTGVINLDLAALTNVSVSILDLDGKVVYEPSKSLDSQLIIELDVAPGLYFIQLKTDEQLKHFKIMMD